MAHRRRHRAAQLPPVEISQERYYQTMAETQEILRQHGRGDLYKHVIAMSGIETAFGSPGLLKYESRRPDSYIGLFQFGNPHVRMISRTEAGQEVGLQPTEVPGRHPYDPYKNQPKAIAASVMHYADNAKQHLGLQSGELNTTHLWAQHLFGMDGGIALLKAAQKDPNMPLSRVPEIKKSWYDANMGGKHHDINWERRPYHQATVGQVVDMIQRHSDRAMLKFPESMPPEMRTAALEATRPRQPASNGFNNDRPEQALTQLASIEEEQRGRIEAVRTQGRSGFIDSVQQRHQRGQPARFAQLSPEEVKKQQQFLIDQGYELKYGADGVMGSETRKAAAKFQKDHKGKDIAVAMKENEAKLKLAEAAKKPEPPAAHAAASEEVETAPAKPAITAAPSAGSVAASVPVAEPPAQPEARIATAAGLKGGLSTAASASVQMAGQLEKEVRPHITVAEAAAPAPAAPAAQPAASGPAPAAPHKRDIDPVAASAPVKLAVTPPAPAPGKTAESLPQLPELSRERKPEKRYVENAYRFLSLNDEAGRKRFRERNGVAEGDKKAELAALSGEIEKVQKGLISSGIQLPHFGPDGKVGEETLRGVAAYRERTRQELPELQRARQSYLEEAPSPFIAPDKIKIPKGFAETTPGFENVSEVALLATRAIGPLPAATVDEAPAAPGRTPADATREAQLQQREATQKG